MYVSLKSIFFSFVCFQTLSRWNYTAYILLQLIFFTPYCFSPVSGFFWHEAIIHSFSLQHEFHYMNIPKFIYLSIVDGQLDYWQFSLFQTFLIWPFSPISWHTYVYIKHYVCSCVYTCIYVCVCVLVYICVYMHVCHASTYMYMCVFVYMCMHEGCGCIRMGMCVYECLSMCVHVCTCVCTHENCPVRGYGYLKLF